MRIGLAKASLLLAYLALHRHGAISRERLAAALWPDDDDATARENLRRHLYRLVRALPPAPPGAPWIAADAATLRWNAEAPAVIDVEAFERAPRAAEALDWYRGDLLAEIDDDWVFGERERLRAVASQRFDDAIAAARAQGETGAAIALAGRLLAHDPFREDAVRLAMRLRADAGDRSGALHAFERFAARLKDDLDVEPMPETRGLYDVLRTDTVPVAGRNGSASVPVADAAEGALPFVGRARERELLREWWGRAKQGRGRVALIGGEAGVGKSRLLAEFAREAAAGGARVLVGATSAPEALPYEAIVAALGPAADDLARLLPRLWLAALAPLVPAVRSAAGDPKQPALAPDRERARSMESVVRALAALAGSAPLLVILEDLHWAGDATLALFATLAARIGRAPILIAATYREEEARGTHPFAAVRRTLRAEGVLAHHTLMPLSLADVDALVAALPPTAVPREERARTLFARSDGNALFLGELVRDNEPTDAPRDIAELVTARVAGLPESVRTVLDVAAIAGRTFAVDTIAAASGWSEAETLAALDALIDAAFIRDAGGVGGMDFAFTHHVMHEIAYGGIAPDRRRRGHHRLAHVLALRGDAVEPAELARHADLGGDPDRAAPAYLAAAERAARLGAVDEAIAAAGRGLALARTLPLLVALHRAREGYLHRAGRRDEQFADIRALTQLAETANDDDARCDALARTIGYHHALSERAEERAAIDRLATFSGATPAWRAFADEARGTLLRELGAYTEAEPPLRAAIDAYRALGDAHAEVRTRCTLAESFALQTRIADADAQASQARADAEASGVPVLRARALAVNTFVALFQNDYERARETAQATLALCRTLGDGDALADAHARLGYAEARLFDVEAAEGAYADAIAEYRKRGSRFGEAIAVLVRGQFRATCGDLDGAAEALAVARPAVDALADPYLTTIWTLDAAMLGLCRGDGALAARYARRGLDLADQVQSLQLQGTALGYLALARNDAAMAMRALGMRRASGQRVDLGFHLALAAAAAADAGLADEALALAREIVTLDDATLRSERFPYFVLAAAARILAGSAGAAPLLRAEAIRDERLLSLPAEARERYAALRFNRPNPRRFRAR